MRRGLAFLAALLALATPPGGRAAPVDLGEGLSYLRVADATVLPETPPGPLVLDLRRARGGDVSRLAALLRSGGPLRFVLLGRETAGDVRALLAHRAASVITLAAGPDIAADIVLEAITPADDLRAYEAHENGTDLTTLIQPPVNKARRDEASILRERANGNGAAQSRGAAAASEDPPAEAAPTDPAEPPLVDAVLQRAVHLHRGLKALGRL